MNTAGIPSKVIHEVIGGPDRVAGCIDDVACVQSTPHRARPQQHQGILLALTMRKVAFSRRESSAIHPYIYQVYAQLFI